MSERERDRQRQSEDRDRAKKEKERKEDERGERSDDERMEEEEEREEREKKNSDLTCTRVACTCRRHCFGSFYHENTQSGTRTFHDLCCLKPLTFHNGFVFFASRSCFKHYFRFQNSFADRVW